MAELAVVAIMGGGLAFAAFIAGILEEYAARQAIIRETERKKREAAERAERIHRKRAAEVKKVAETGYRFWGGYIGGQHIQ